MNINNWLDRATEKICFDPDRAAVRRELEDHLQDRQERYAAKGLSPEEAEAASLADMGDPADIAEELGKLHRPFWGYLWTFSKLLLGFAFILALIRVCTYWDTIWPGSMPARAVHLYELYSDLSVVSEQRLPDSATVGHYTVSASAILLEPTAEGKQQLCLSLRFLPHILGEPVNLGQLYDGLFDRSLTDDSGRLYLMENGWLRDAGTARGIIFSYLEFCIRLEDGEFPEWLDVPLGISNYILRVDLEEGVSLQ